MKISAFIISILLLSSVNCSSPYDQETTKGRTFWGFVLAPVNLALDIVSAPFHYMAGPCSGMNEGDKNHYKAMRIMERKALSEEEIKQALDFLSASAIEGNPLALYHMGRLMLKMPEEKLMPLSQMVDFNIEMGWRYLKTAGENKVDGATKMANELQGMVALSSAVSTANGWDDGLPNQHKAREIVINAAEHKNPYAAYFIAEAILKQGDGAFGWLYVEKKDMYGRRISAVPLLRFAVASSLPAACELLAELELEDKVYEEICRMISRDKDIPINGIRLGDPGFQEAYIDAICKKEIEVLGHTISLERAVFLKQAMMMRTSHLFHFLSYYCQYVGQKSQEKQSDTNVALKLIVDYVVGKTEVVLSAINAGDKPAVFNFTNNGLLCPVTPLDANTAYRRLVYLDEDFTT